MQRIIETGQTAGRAAGDVGRDEARGRHRRASPGPGVGCGACHAKPAGVAPEIEQHRSPAAGSPESEQAQPQAPASVGNNPSPDPQDVAAIGADFERLYQRDVKAGIEAAARAGEPEPPVAEPKPQASAFRSFLREHGIAPELAADVTGERDSGQFAAPSTFRKGGLQLDQLVQRGGVGFLTDNQVESALDNGGVNRLIEMIQSEIRGERQVSTELAGDQASQALQRRASDDLDAQARAIGLDTKGMDDGQIAAWHCRASSAGGPASRAWPAV